MHIPPAQIAAQITSPDRSLMRERPPLSPSEIKPMQIWAGQQKYQQRRYIYFFEIFMLFAYFSGIYYHFDNFKLPK